MSDIELDKRDEDDPARLIRKLQIIIHTLKLEIKDIKARLVAGGL